jgi:hypothetical protein
MTVPNSSAPQDVNEQIAATPLPSARELRRRSSLIVQLVRFVILNLKILRLSRRKH